ncbi:hypothetical protein GQ600_3776 [Phytophthora cactorum]|nr:hypothetical protein GQ600_3776 [Phytophthora cactorum]
MYDMKCWDFTENVVLYPSWIEKKTQWLHLHYPYFSTQKGDKCCSGWKSGDYYGVFYARWMHVDIAAKW